MMNPDLYAVLPPGKKEEYKKLFPIPDLKPLYTQNIVSSLSGDSWMWPGIVKDERLSPGIGVLGKIKTFPEGEPIIDGVVLDLKNGIGCAAYETGYYSLPLSGEYIISVHGDGSGSFIHPPIAQGASTARYSEYKKSQPEIGLSHGEQRLIKKGVVDK